jgi:hypothetical protein
MIGTDRELQPAAETQEKIPVPIALSLLITHCFCTFLKPKFTAKSLEVRGCLSRSGELVLWDEWVWVKAESFPVGVARGQRLRRDRRELGSQRDEWRDWRPQNICP